MKRNVLYAFITLLVIYISILLIRNYPFRYINIKHLVISEKVRNEINKEIKLNRYGVFHQPFRKYYNKNDVYCVLKNAANNIMLYSELVKIYNRCALVTSSGSLVGSRHGSDIDSHDAVIRFNDAIVKGFEKDVGSKTSLRIVNSQLVFKRPLFSKRLHNIAVWDPSKYNENITSWMANPEFNFFPVLRNKKDYDIISPKFIWKLWDIIQSYYIEQIQPNPPSSGFIGIVIAMQICNTVTIYEYIPSKQTDLCHYWTRDINPFCSQGSYHPLTFEKNIIKDIGNIKAPGIITVSGFSKISC
ncbi:23-sialyltransferase [NY_014 poxvirus]|uniref:23-sialyltransferase n=1 Tax=NY_014 poxvirus TaxID=2025360 RepID=UPI000B99F49E|nr:23-sialyltransferase [NY_014 poxvirus]AST09556.1 23-sialyltransferase [NY_014 poxvirus]